MESNEKEEDSGTVERRPCAQGAASVCSSEKLRRSGGFHFPSRPSSQLMQRSAGGAALAAAPAASASRPLPALAPPCLSRRRQSSTSADCPRVPPRAAPDCGPEGPEGLELVRADRNLHARNLEPPSGTTVRLARYCTNDSAISPPITFLARQVSWPGCSPDCRICFVASALPAPRRENEVVGRARRVTHVHNTTAVDACCSGCLLAPFGLWVSGC